MTNPLPQRPVLTARRQAVALYLAAAILIVGGAAHVLQGWTLVREISNAAELGSRVASTLGVGWQLGSVSLVTFGIVALAAGVERSRGRPVAVVTIWIVATALTAFGIGALLLGDRRYALFFFGYILISGLLALGVLPDPLAQPE